MGLLIELGRVSAPSVVSSAEHMDCCQGCESKASQAPESMGGAII